MDGIFDLETKEQWKELNRCYAKDKQNWFDLMLIALGIKPRVAHPDWKNIAVITSDGDEKLDNRMNFGTCEGDEWPES